MVNETGVGLAIGLSFYFAIVLILTRVNSGGARAFWRLLFAIVLIGSWVELSSFGPIMLSYFNVSSFKTLIEGLVLGIILGNVSHTAVGYR